jgi:hypothetical protein
MGRSSGGKVMIESNARFLLKRLFAGCSMALICFVTSHAKAQFTLQGSKLVGSGATTGSQFGLTVAADSSTGILYIAVGGPGSDGGAGQVWFSKDDGGSWSLFPISDESSNAAAGWCMNFTQNTAIVGAPRDNSFNGSVEVFDYASSTWTQQGSKLADSTLGASDFGYSCALSRSQTTAIIGTPFANCFVTSLGGTACAGGADVFISGPTGWSKQASLAGTGQIGGAFLGSSVAVSDDGNTVFLGGPNDNSTTAGQVGAGWVFTRDSSGVWTEQSKVVGTQSKVVGTGGVPFAGTRPFGQGFSVTLSGDGNTAALGAPGDNGGAGAVWVFKRSGATWTQQGSKLVGTGAAGNAAQGWAGWPSGRTEPGHRATANL